MEQSETPEAIEYKLWRARIAKQLEKELERQQMIKNILIEDVLRRSA